MPDFTITLGRNMFAELDRLIMAEASNYYPGVDIAHFIIPSACPSPTPADLDNHPVGQEIEYEGVVIKKGKKGWEVVQDDCPFL